MGSVQVKEILDRLEDMAREMEKVQRDLEDYHKKMKHSIDTLEQEGLPKEYVETFRSEHVEKLSRYFNGLAEHMEQEAIPYTKQVITKTSDLLNTM